MTIEILLATYNGEKYIETQIESIFKQTYKDWKLYIRDDGSKDGTISILEKYQNEYPEKIVLIKDKMRGLGAAKNFLEILKFTTADYIMFCDQDDYWKEDKIQLALEKMLESEINGKNRPIVVHSDLVVVDEKLKTLNGSFFKYQKLDYRVTELNRLLVQNNITGCTMMINSKMREMLKDVPDKMKMHDWWIALIASAFGKIEFINKPTMLYRQHSNNTLGANKWGVKLILNKAKNQDMPIKGIIETQIQAENFLEVFKEKLSQEQKKILNKYINISTIKSVNKIFRMFKYRFFKMNTVRTLGFILLMLKIKK